MALMDVKDVLWEIDYNSDSDFDGYVSEDWYEWRQCLWESEECGDNEVSIPEYQETNGYTIDMTKKISWDFFCLLVSDDMLEEIFN